MNSATIRSSIARFSCLALGGLALVACQDATTTVQAQESTPEVDATKAPASEPVPERVLERSKARWDLIVRANEEKELWIEVYHFLTPSVQKAYPITAYLPTKEQFSYDQPSEPKILKIVDNRAYVAVRATWLAYLHEEVKKAHGGGSLVKPFQSIEEWHWIDDEWYLEQPHRESDFHRENPDFFKRDKAEGK